MKGIATRRSTDGSRLEVTQRSNGGHEPSQDPSRGGLRTDRTIHIAAALIDDGCGHLLLVRKAGTRWFMQAGGKIETGETAIAALRRELEEEIGVILSDEQLRFLGQFSAPAANEGGCTVEAQLFHARLSQAPRLGAEIAEAVWVGPDEAIALPLAPLTRDHVITLFSDL